MELHIKIIGIILVVLAASHLLFPRYFDWEKELRRLSLINRQIMEVHTFFIGLIVLLVGVLCLSATSELIATPLGKKISLGLGLFWLTRLFTQFFGYSPAVWRGKPFETAVHVVFSVLWTYLSAVFLLVYFI
jgi:hypothetical protein